MPSTSICHPGDLAPATGLYRLLNIFGTETAQWTRGMEGEPLPDAPQGFMWQAEPGPG
jgi:hypothetical protein